MTEEMTHDEQSNSESTGMDATNNTRTNERSVSDRNGAELHSAADSPSDMAGDTAAKYGTISGPSAINTTEDEDTDETDSSDDSVTPDSNGSKPVPAATANSYRDIIAIRLAERAAQNRPKPGSEPAKPSRPMAHTSEWKEGKTPEPESTKMLQPKHEMPSAIQNETQSQVTVGSERQDADRSPSQNKAVQSSNQPVDSEGTEKSGQASARDRARQRQRERAELRRGGNRTSYSSRLGEREIDTNAEESIAPISETTFDHTVGEELLLHEEGAVEPDTSASPNAESDFNATKIVRRNREEEREGHTDRNSRRSEPRIERPRNSEPRNEDRPQQESRGERPPREERPERTRREDRPERAPREVQPPALLMRGDRGEHPPRERISTERRPVERPSRPIEAIPDAALNLKGGTPLQSEQSLQRAKALASRLGISVVIPLYNEQESLRELTAALKSQLFKLAGSRYQIIFVNDGSTDRSGDILRDLLEVTSRVTVLSFRRNMGKSPALAVGFREVKYGIVITMDADLQDDPAEMPNLIAKLDEGFDVVSGWKKKRYDPITKTIPSKFFNSVTSFFAGVKLHDFNSGLKAYRKEVTDSLDVYGEMHRYLPALAHWKGFKVGEIPVVHHPRKFGKSKFGSSRFFKGFLDLLSIVFTNRYGKRPLHLFGTVGTLLTIAGLAINGYVSVEWAMGLTALSNRPILLLGILLILVGFQLISLGLLGEMIVKQTNRAGDFVAVRERGSRLPEDRERARRDGTTREGSGRVRADRVSPDRQGRREDGSPDAPRQRRESRSRDEGEGNDSRNSSDALAQRRMGRDRRRRSR